MAKSEDVRLKMIGEINITEELLKNGDITQDQYNSVVQFLKAEISKYDRGAYVGFDAGSRAIQSQSRDEIKRTLGIDVSSFMSRYGSFVSNPAMRVGDIGFYTGPYTSPDYRYSQDAYNKLTQGSWSDVDYSPESSIVLYITNVGTSYSDDLSNTNDIEDSIAAEVSKAMNETMDRDAAKILMGQYGSGASEMIWREYGGVVLCECDDPDCDSQIDITHDEYIHASGHGGYYRVTNSECNYGVLGAYLVERGKNYRVWTKMA